MPFDVINDVVQLVELPVEVDLRFELIDAFLHESLSSQPVSDFQRTIISTIVILRARYPPHCALRTQIAVGRASKLA
jgi:hypothetical protein